MDYREAMHILRQWRVFAPSIVRLDGRFHIFSRTALISSGPSIEEALRAGELFPVPSTLHPIVPFIAHEANVLRGNYPVCVARSKTMAERIANALNEYTPGDRNK